MMVREICGLCHSNELNADGLCPSCDDEEIEAKREEKFRLYPREICGLCYSNELDADGLCPGCDAEYIEERNAHLDKHPNCCCCNPKTEHHGCEFCSGCYAIKQAERAADLFDDLDWPL